MLTLTNSLCLVLLLHQVVGPPPRNLPEPNSNEHEENDVNNNNDALDALGIEYNRYLKEVVKALESDSEFRAKLEKAEEADIRNGRIASELEYVDHKVRTKLDELKRQEVERLRHLAQREYELRNGIDIDHLKIPPEHLDHENPHTFEIEDLRKLILKTTKDLAEADEKRRQDFKEYEMQKEFEKNEKLKTLDEEHKKEFEKEVADNETKHKRHAPLHHPGSKQQLEEVWEKQDHMDKNDFDPKVFFNLHDLDGNGVWDQDEVKTLFLKELDKLYEAGAPEDDMRERAEEMERMREHVFKEADINKDGLISYEEFLAQTKQPEFEKDNGWESLDQQQIYTHEEYLEFERKRQEQIQQMIQQGLIPPQPVYPPHGYPQHPQFQQHEFPQGHHPQGGQFHPGQIPQGQYHPNQIPQHPNQQGHPGQGHPGQVPPQPHTAQGHPGQVPPQQHPGQVPPQQHPGQVPPQQHPGQVPPQQHPGQGYPQEHPPSHPAQLPPQHQQAYQPEHHGQVPPQGQHPNQGYQQERHDQQQQHYQPQQAQNYPPRQLPPQVPSGGQYQPHPNVVPQYAQQPNNDKNSKEHNNINQIPQTKDSKHQ